MAKLLIDSPTPLKAKLDALKSQGYTASGYTRALLERELATVKPLTKKEDDLMDVTTREWFTILAMLKKVQSEREILAGQCRILIQLLEEKGSLSSEGLQKLEQATGK